MTDKLLHKDNNHKLYFDKVTDVRISNCYFTEPSKLNWWQIPSHIARWRSNRTFHKFLDEVKESK